MSEVYIPALESQRDQSAPLPWTNCTLASGAMLVDWWTWGKINTDDITLRTASGISVQYGVNFASLRKAIAKQLGLQLLYSESDGSGNAQLTWEQLRKHLAEGGAAVIAGSYSALAKYRAFGTGLSLTRWQPGGNFGHAILALDYRPATNGGDGGVLLMDPLGHSGYRGDRTTLTALWDFIYSSGKADQNVRVSAAWGFEGARPDRLNKDDYFDRAGVKVRQLEAHIAADIEAIRVELRTGRQL